MMALRVIALAAAALVCAVPQAHAALQFTLTTGDSVAAEQLLLSDSNKCPAEGPRAAYVAGELTNTGANAETGIIGNLSGLSGNFSLTGSQQATFSVGALAPGDTVMVGWLVTYPCDKSKSSAGAANSPATIGISADSGATAGAAITLISRRAQSANAGGNVLSTTLGAGAVVGQIITADVQFDFGNIDSDNEFFLQPAGNTDFDAACLQLIGSTITASNITAIPVGASNQMHFVSPVQQSGNNYSATARFYFRYMCAGVVTTARPYSAQTSGSSNIKYTGNYDGGGNITFDFPTSTNPFTITKTGTPEKLTTGDGPHTATYTVTVANPSAFDTLIDGFNDTLPSGASFVGLTAASDVTAANSSSVPATGATGTLAFGGYGGASYALGAGSSVSLVYQASIPDIDGQYVNTASAVLGSTPVGPASFTILVGRAILGGSKSVVIHDPADLGLYALPGNDVVYTISITNLGTGAADEDSLFLVDKLPGEVTFYAGDGTDEPLIFAGGTSGLTWAYATDAGYADIAAKPANFSECDYTPEPGYDPAVTYICFAPKGSMAAGDPDPNFSVSFRARID